MTDPAGTVLAPIPKIFFIIACAGLLICFPGAGPGSAQVETGTDLRPEDPASQTSSPLEAQDDIVTFSGLLDCYGDLIWLTRFEQDVTCRQFSSYDRAGWKANRDWENYLRSSDEEGHVAAEVDGPGVLLNLWSANPSGRILFYLDGADSPVLDLDMVGLFDDQQYPFVDPLVYRVSGANAYLPIPFQTSCKVVIRDNEPLYYRMIFKTFGEDTKIESYSADGAAAAKDRLESLLSLLRDPGPHLVDALYSGEKETIALKAMVRPGKSSELFSRLGPGMVALLELDARTLERNFLRKTMLNIFWDGQMRPAVSCPLGDFFGTPFEETLYQALPMGRTKSGGYCLFPMPFSKGVYIELTNQGEFPLEVTGRLVLAASPDTDPVMRFHAGWRRENPCTQFDYTVLKARGPGRFVGCALFIDNPQNRWWGEGDEKIWIDDEDFPSFFGTGTENYFGDAWGLRYHIKPYQGCNLLQNPYHGNKTCAYRFHIADSILFERSFKMVLENYSDVVDYSSVAWWYSANPGGSHFFTDMPVRMRLPGKPLAIGGLEAEDINLTTEEGEIFPVNDEDLPQELSGGKGLLLKGPGPYTMALDAPEAGNYIIRLMLASDMSHSSVVVHSQDSTSMLPTMIPEGTAGRMEPIEAAWIKLKKGKNKIDIMLGNGQSETPSVVLDSVFLEPLERAECALEAEKLRIRSVTGGVASVEDFTLPWSGGSQVRFIAAAMQSRLDLELPVHVEGIFILSGACSRTAGYGSFTLSIDDKPLGEINPAQLEGSDEIGHFTLNAGFLEQGTRILSIITDSAAGLDYVRLDWTLGDEHVYEGEDLNALESQGGNVLTQDLNPTLFSRGRQLWFQAQETGAFIEVELPAQMPGEYRLKVFYGKSWDYGTVRLYLNGRQIGADFNGYNPGLQPSGVVDYGLVNLDSGLHRLKFEIVGKDNESFGHYMGIDAIMLIPW